MGEFSFGELVVIIIIAIIIYGKNLPQAARKLASLYSKFKRQLSDVRDEISRQIPAEELKIDVPTDLGPGGEPPYTPSGLVASPSTGQVLLTWNSSVGASSYTIRRSPSAQDSWVIIAMNISELSYADPDVSPGKTYHYVISAVNTTGESGNSDEAVVTMPAGEGEAQPAAPSAENKPAAEAVAGNGNDEYPKEPSPPDEKGANGASSSPAPAPDPTPSSGA